MSPHFMVSVKAVNLTDFCILSFQFCAEQWAYNYLEKGGSWKQ